MTNLEDLNWILKNARHIKVLKYENPFPSNEAFMIICFTNIIQMVYDKWTLLLKQIRKIIPFLLHSTIHGWDNRFFLCYAIKIMWFNSKTCSKQIGENCYRNHLFIFWKQEKHKKILASLLCFRLFVLSSLILQKNTDFYWCFFLLLYIACIWTY